MNPPKWLLTAIWRGDIESTFCFSTQAANMERLIDI